MSCDHKWVVYQPLKGPEVECCAKAGCGITKELWFWQQAQEVESKEINRSPSPATYGDLWSYYNQPRSVDKIDLTPIIWSDTFQRFEPLPSGSTPVEKDWRYYKSNPDRYVIDEDDDGGYI